MSSRERWTVYPLLFLAIGLALRAALLPPEFVGEVDAAKVTCREFLVIDEAGHVLIHAGRVRERGGGGIVIRDGDKAVTIDADSEYARQDSNLQPSVPKTDALSN